MKAVKFTKEELESKSATELRVILKEMYNYGVPISRTPKPQLIEAVEGMQKLKPFKATVSKVTLADGMVIVSTVLESEKKASTEIVTENKINKSDLLRKEVRRRARAQETLNSGELIKFMAATHDIKMSRQFIVNVRNRFLTACPELLKA
jgi:hypothetical protein